MELHRFFRYAIEKMCKEKKSLNHFNIILSKNRAAAVGNYLRTAGIETNNITEDGKGYSEPIADNTSEAGRAKNRRVEIFITNDEY